MQHQEAPDQVMVRGFLRSRAAARVGSLLEQHARVDSAGRACCAGFGPRPRCRTDPLPRWSPARRLPVTFRERYWSSRWELLDHLCSRSVPARCVSLGGRQSLGGSGRAAHDGLEDRRWRSSWRQCRRTLGWEVECTAFGALDVLCAAMMPAWTSDPRCSSAGASRARERRSAGGKWPPRTVALELAGEQACPGVPESRSPGVPESRSPGVPECRSAGVPECRSAGVPVSRCPGVPVSRCPGVPVSRCPGVPVSRCPGVPVSRCPGVPVSRCPGVPVSRCLGHGGAGRTAADPSHPRRHARDVARLALLFTSA
ncbi:hypothetical protein EDF19_0051 [Curtobacterium sp. PhB115]|nr:hypothetical protein EDF19_0051 [Curtobacterium sp. PhB115]